MCNKIILSSYVLKENENQNSVLWQNESLNFNMYTEGSTFMGCIQWKSVFFLSPRQQIRFVNNIQNVCYS